MGWRDWRTSADGPRARPTPPCSTGAVRRRPFWWPSLLTLPVAATRLLASPKGCAATAPLPASQRRSAYASCFAPAWSTQQLRRKLPATSCAQVALASASTRHCLPHLIGASLRCSARPTSGRARVGGNLQSAAHAGGFASRPAAASLRSLLALASEGTLGPAASAWPTVRQWRHPAKYALPSGASPWPPLLARAAHGARRALHLRRRPRGP